MEREKLRVLKCIFVALVEVKLSLVASTMFTNKPEILGTELFLAFGFT